MSYLHRYLTVLTILLLSIFLFSIHVFGLKIKDKPVKDPVDSQYKFYSRWFIQPDPNKHCLHCGADIAAPNINKKSVYAVKKGKVIFTGVGKKGSGYYNYGKIVVINHENDFKTLYAHLSEILVTKGQQVNEGQEIGKVGSTGQSTGPHLHYEVRNPNGEPVYPGNPEEENYKKITGPTGGPDGGPGGDHPDEGKSPPIRDIPQMYYYKDMLDVLVLYWGYPKFISSLLAKLNISKMYVGIEDNFKNMLGISKILIIPTGGLYGLSNSEIFKTMLSEYVKNGGIIVAFTQQHGYEFGVLPGSPSGYGWTEDQSCQAQAAQIDEYHQILAGQKDLRFDGGIDGFFMQWPENAKVLLRRTKNNMPALILYPYGKGYVIATIIYNEKIDKNEHRLFR